jgi:repressor LexA
MSNIQFSNKDLEGIRYIRNTTVHKGTAPSVRQIMSFLGYKSPNSALLFINKLIESKIVERDKKTGKLKFLRDPEHERHHAMTIDIPLVGNVPCGAPLLAEENIEAHIPVSTRLAKPPYKYFLLRAVGDSMNKKGINGGDLILVKQQHDAENGESVVALINDEATVKELNKDHGSVILNPKSSNPKHKPIILTEDFQIQGVVAAVISNLYI